MGGRPERARATRSEAIAEAIRRRIAIREFATGEKLPSIRGLARSVGASPSTVAEAYERLSAEGLIRSRPGSGFLVAGALPLALAEVEPRADRAVDPFWVSRQSLDGGSQALRPGCGWLPPDWMPVDALRRATRLAARGEAALLAEYGPARGPLALRAVLARRFAAEGLEAGPERILLTPSGTQALDLVCRFLLQPGDTVLLDDPCYFNFQALLRAHRVRIVGVPMTAAGPDPARFAEALSAHRPRLYVTNSAIHNPTGATLSPQTAHRLLALAAAHDLTVVEDDILAEFEPDPSPRLAVLDGLARVVRIGSFSKTLSASVRCGFVAARADWIEGLVDLQVATHFGGPSPLAAAILGSVLADGAYRRHMEALRARLARARREAGALLERLGCRPWLQPRGGFTLWCDLPDGADGAAVARRALAQGMVLAPGDAFSLSRTAGGRMRFNVAQMPDPRTAAILADALGAR